MGDGQLSLTPFETILFFKKQFYYFKKGKNVTETQNRVVQYMEKVLRLIKLILKISHWMVLHGSVDQLMLTAIKQRH